MEDKLENRSRSDYERIIDEIRRNSMTLSMYEKLTSLTLENAWHVIESEVLPELIDKSYYLVRYPDEATDFDLNNVYTKICEDKSCFQRCCCGSGDTKKARMYRYATKLNSIFKPEERQYLSYFDQEAYGIPRDYIFDSAGRGSVNIDKTLMFKIKGTRRMYGSLDEPNWKEQMSVCGQNLALGQAKSVYVVNEVIVADSLIIQASIRDHVKRWEYKGPVPLAFRFIKLKLKRSGEIRPMLPIKILPRWNDDEPVEWERPSDTKSKFLRTCVL